MPAHSLAEYQDFAASEEWHQRLLAMLETAGLWVRREEDSHKPSPVQFVYVSQVLKSAGQQPVGERHLCFTVHRFARKKEWKRCSRLTKPNWNPAHSDSESRYHSSIRAWPDSK